MRSVKDHRKNINSESQVQSIKTRTTPLSNKIHTAREIPKIVKTILKVPILIQESLEYIK